MLSWKIQADALGGLHPDLARRLRRGSATLTARGSLAAGTRLSREWKGDVHEVEAVDGGFRYRGETYRSLSKIAGVITGVKWNGRRFFGLDRDAAQ
jgi:hypothetical protein